jgi:hypothetical protein
MVMDELTAPQQNRLLAGLSNLLRRVEQDSGPEFLPRGLDVMGLVRQLALPSAETVEKMSYGDPLFRMPTQSNIPITTDRGYLAEVLGMLPAVPAASRATTRLSNEAADALVRQITGRSDATAMRALEEIGQMSPVPQMFDPKQVKSVLPKTKVVDEEGNPKLMYHGTAKDIQGFIPGPSGASYASPDPKFAEKFSEYSQDRSLKELADQIDQNPAEKERLLSSIIDEAMERGDLTSANFPYHQELAKAGFLPNLDMYTKDYWLDSFMNRPLKDAFDTVGIGKDVTRSVSEMTTTGPNMLPVYVDAKNPFDYEKPAHVNKVVRALAKDDPDFYEGTTIGRNLKRALASGDWDSIEGTDVQEVIKKLGFDSFYVKEQGVKNLGVFDPNQIKSAISDPTFQGLLEP